MDGPPAGMVDAVGRFNEPARAATVNGVTLAYQVFGSGHPLVLINGFASTMDT